jgi:hypothetical protein
LENELTSAEKEKSLFTENQLELLTYEASIAQQITYDRKKDYFFLIDNYLQELISPSNF